MLRFLVTACFLHSAAFALDCPNPFPQHFTSIHADSNSACAIAKPFADALDRMRWLSRRPPPQVLNISVASSAEDKYSSFGAITIPSTTSERMALSLHEYGHAVCADRMSQAIPRVAKYVENQKQINEEFRKTNVTLVDLQSQIDKVKRKSPMTEQDQVHQIELMKKMQAAQSAMMSRKQALEETPEFLQTLAPYHELCADVVSVISLQNPTAVTEALSKILSEKNRKAHQIELRDFSRTHPNIQKDACREQTHAVLAPVRSELGKMGINQLDSEIKKTLFFEKFISVLNRHLAIELNAHNCDSFRKNSQFIESLNKDWNSVTPPESTK